LRWDGEGLLFDPGEGTQRQFIYAGIPPTVITRVFLTHFHGDHCLGMAGLFQRLSLDRVPHPVHIYYPASGEKYLANLRRASIYRDMLTVEYHPIRESGLIHDAGPFQVVAQRLDHGVETFGYRIQEPTSRRFDKLALAEIGLQGPAVGKLLTEGSIEHQGKVLQLEEVSYEQPGSSFAFVMDTRVCEGARRLLQDATLAVCESTFLDSEESIAQEYGHLTVGQATRLAAKAGTHNLVLAHFSQRYRNWKDFRDAGEKIFPGVHIAKDMMQLEFPRLEAVK
jgi:ribonuclease Z